MTTFLSHPTLSDIKVEPSRDEGFPWCVTAQHSTMGKTSLPFKSRGDAKDHAERLKAEQDAIALFPGLIAQCDVGVRARRRVELNVVLGLVRHLASAGWKPWNINAGGEDLFERKPEISPAEVIEHVFSVDETWVNFIKDGRSHGVFIVLGNDGWDAISDWQFSENDPDGFDAEMQKFDPESFA